MANLLIPTPLRKFTGGAGLFESDASDVAALLDHLVARHPDIRPHLFDDSGTLRTFIRLYVGDEEIDALDGVATALTPGADVSIIPAIAGGHD